MVKNTILLVLVCSFGSIRGQQSKILNGIVTSDNGDVVGVVIQTSNQKESTITNNNGEFSIRVSRNDTLIFLAVQFKRKVIPVNEAVFTAKYITVPLEEFVNKLKGVTVQPYNLSGDLTSDLSNLNIGKNVSAEALGLPNADAKILSQSENKLNDADHGKFVYFYGVGFAINVNKILNRLSGRTKMLKHRVKLDAEYETIQQVEAKYLDSVFMGFLKIPKNRFYDFMYYCQVDSNFEKLSEARDDLALWQFLIDKSKIYRRENDLD